MGTNDITGAPITSKIANNNRYAEGWDDIFAKETAQWKCVKCGAVYVHPANPDKEPHCKNASCPSTIEDKLVRL